MRLQAAQTLQALGFSEIESLVYCFLLKESPATGYRVSHAIGKPTANTYKAIAALAQRGAIVVDDSESRLLRAVPQGELLDRLNRDFETKRREAEAELSKIRQASGDDRVYYLASVEQVIERARTMITNARDAVLLDLFPQIVPLVAPQMEAAAKRGVKVAARTYAPVAIKGAVVVTSKDSERVLTAWPGQQISVAADADEFLTALLSQDISGVHQALWSSSTFLSCLQYNALHVEIVLTAINDMGRADGRAIEALSLTRLKPPGFEKLKERYGDGAAPKRKKRA
jgi:HTH-type transcriptional regulator, sugar sensing transcriptional regulator